MTHCSFFPKCLLSHPVQRAQSWQFSCCSVFSTTQSSAAPLTRSGTLPTAYSWSSRAQWPSHAPLNTENCYCLFKNVASVQLINLLNKCILRTSTNIRSSKFSLWICSSYFPLTKKDQDLSLRYRKQMEKLHAVLIDENESFSALCHYSSLYDSK